MRTFFITASLLAASFAAYPAIELPHIIGSNMVVQQNSDFKLWGKASPNTKVTLSASWDKNKVSTKSDAEGNWTLSVRTPPASFTPLSITISDGEPLTLDNLLSGDVWICAGQSNMEMPLSGFTSQPVDDSLDHIMKASQKRDNLRFFTVDRVRSYDDEKVDCGGEWLVCSPQSAAEFSAVGYFFGNNIAEATDIPIGLIAADFGDTRVEAWMPLDALREATDEKGFEEKHSNHWCKPSEMYCGIIAPIRDFKAKGFIWYQGESNRKDYHDYAKLLAKLVERWRKDWGDTDGSMPFYYVQIAPFIYDGSREISCPLFVEAQEQALDLIPNSGMATTTDLGEEYMIHPSRKSEVGQRLAALALLQTYNMGGFEAKAPRLNSFRVEDGKIILKMDNADKGVGPWSHGPIVGFEIAGEDRVFHPARAHTSDNPKGEVRVWSDEVKNPVAVRYAFRNFIKGNLQNTFGIPAAPFRTDNWNDVK